MVPFPLWMCFAVLISLGTSAPHQEAMRVAYPVSEDFHETDSLEDELPGRSELQPVSEIEESLADHDVSRIQNADIEVKDILLRFFKKLKNHPEILQQLIESEEKRLLGSYENMLQSEPIESNRNSNTATVSPVESPIRVPYESEKTVVKKAGSSQIDFVPEYDPRSAPDVSGLLSGSDVNNNIPLVPANQQHNAQLSASEIANLREEESQASPVINSLPLFDTLPNPHSADKLASEKIKTKSSQSTVKPPRKISQASFDSNIEEIKHVPIREELASEVPPSLLADKKELREEAHQALKKAEAEALKTKKFQAALQKEQLKQMSKEQKDKYKQEVYKKEQQDQKQQQLDKEDQQKPETTQDNEVVQQNAADPYGYYYYYYNYPELAQQLFNGDSEELPNESYQQEQDSSVSDSVGSSKQQGSYDSSESQETSMSNESNSNESGDVNHISSEEVTVDDNESSRGAQSFDQENELKALTKSESVQRENELNNM